MNTDIKINKYKNIWIQIYKFFYFSSGYCVMQPLGDDHLLQALNLSGLVAIGSTEVEI